MEYKKTLNLPQTDFPMRANAKAVEEKYLLKWENENIYQQWQTKNSQQPKYILHDGPPYPNGDIHLGHALNKILKDIVIKYKNMQGFSAPYIPGWDCHGLPIETQLVKEIGDKRAEMSINQFRELCKQYALKYVDLQRGEFKKLGIFGQWDNPYLTLNPAYEAKVIELFGILAEKGYIYRGLKPIHWCPQCETALAEAEIEYEDEKSPSIYVKFKISNAKSQINSKCQNPNLPFDLPWYAVIWTTTPWTLPANVAIAAHPDYEYVFMLVADKEVYLLAEGLLEDFIKRNNLTDYKILDRTKGKLLEGILARHPFIERDALLVLDKYVTLEQGTGLVHIAPGHGEEDYKVGLNYKLPIVMPVDEKGYFDNSVPEFIRGQYYDAANKIITQHLQAMGALLKLEFIKHPYPHCWRCKKPVIFRATEQWFVNVDHANLRQTALQAIANTQWFPAWGENRIRGMVETRPDWCISRQRSWGIPVPAFYCKSCKKALTTGIFNESIRKMVAEQGTNGWFEKTAAQILPPTAACPHCAGKEFTKETDILDVWFESGSSHAAVLEQSPGHRWPADLYLEGSDQHRGWFQTSLLLGIGYRGRAPYQAVLTHGFTIDDKGRKMSKSSGNVVDPQEVAGEYGADILRLWVASTDFRNDMAASKSILGQVRDAYSKIRNTCRFLLSNLNDFNNEEAIDCDQLLEIDRWILLRLHRLIEKVTQAYDSFELHVVYHALYSFCVNDLSAYYLDMSKDRLYCDGKNSLERRSAQMAMREILLALIKMLAPILSFTAEDIFQYARNLHSQVESVFLLHFPLVNREYLDADLEERWEKIMHLREEVYQQLEVLRSNKEISSSLEAKVKIGQQGKPWVKDVVQFLPMVLIVSQVELTEDDKIVVERALGDKCERCWMHLESVGHNHSHPTLCDRCASVVGLVGL